MDMKLSIALTNYGDLLKRYRTIFQQYYSNKAIRKYDDILSNITSVMLKRLKTSPEKFFDHARLFVNTYVYDFMDMITNLLQCLRIHHYDYNVWRAYRR